MDEMIHAMAGAFEETKVPYVLIGGIAASLLGRPRMTMDSDVVVVLSSEEAASFVRTMKGHGFSVTAGSEPKMIARLYPSSSVLENGFPLMSARRAIRSTIVLYGVQEEEYCLIASYLLSALKTFSRTSWFDSTRSTNPILKVSLLVMASGWTGDILRPQFEFWRKRLEAIQL